MPEASSFRKVTGNASDGLLFIGSPPDSSASKEYQQLYREYLTQYPEGPSFELLLRSTFDAVIAIFNGIETAGPNPPKIKEFLKSYKTHGALGAIEFDDNGDIKEINYTLKQIMGDGSIKIIETW